MAAARFVDSEGYGVFVYRHPKLVGMQRYRIGPYEDVETAAAVGYLLFGSPHIDHKPSPYGWYTSFWNRLQSTRVDDDRVNWIDYTEVLPA